MNISKYVLASLVFSTAVLAAPPVQNFNGKVSEIYVNGTQVLMAVGGTVTGTCTGSWGPYNLTFDLADPAAAQKFALIQSAFENGKTIAGKVQGCGSSNINKLYEVAIF